MNMFKQKLSGLVCRIRSLKLISSNMKPQGQGTKVVEKAFKFEIKHTESTAYLLHTNYSKRGRRARAHVT